jgi:hypothetical protein
MRYILECAALALSRRNAVKTILGARMPYTVAKLYHARKPERLYSFEIAALQSVDDKGVS